MRIHGDKILGILPPFAMAEFLHCRAHYDMLVPELRKPCNGAANWCVTVILDH